MDWKVEENKFIITMDEEERAEAKEGYEAQDSTRPADKWELLEDMTCNSGYTLQDAESVWMNSISQRTRDSLRRYNIPTAMRNAGDGCKIATIGDFIAELLDDDNGDIFRVDHIWEWRPSNIEWMDVLLKEGRVEFSNRDDLIPDLYRYHTYQYQITYRLFPSAMPHYETLTAASVPDVLLDLARTLGLHDDISRKKLQIIKVIQEKQL